MKILTKPLTAPTRLLIALCLTQSLALGAGLWIRGQFQTSLVEMTRSVDHPAFAPTEAEVLSIVNAVSFFWICGLQAAAAWLLVQRLLGDEIRRSEESREQALVAAKELVRTRDAVIFGLAKLAESRDPETGQHLERISLYSMKLASSLRKHPKYRDLVTPSFIKTIGISSVLHDIGKVGVEDAILLKPGKLNETERFRIQVHTKLGGDCIRQIERRLGDSEFLRMAREIALYHHERWDGTGYPDGLRGEAIPLAARIVAIADVYDALSVVRVYKPAFPHEYCVQEIRNGAGAHFDPELVKVFLEISEQFREIAVRFSDLASKSERRSRDQERMLTSMFESEHVVASVRRTAAKLSKLAPTS